MPLLLTFRSANGNSFTKLINKSLLVIMNVCADSWRRAIVPHTASVGCNLALLHPGPPDRAVCWPHHRTAVSGQRRAEGEPP